MRSILWLTAALAVLSSSLHAQAPAAPPPIKVDVKRVTVMEQLTPQFSAGNVRDKRWRPKNWIEVDVELDVKLPAEAGGNRGTYAGLVVNVYLATNHLNKDGKRDVFQGSFDVTNVPAGESHVLGYVSPSVMKAVFLKDVVTASTDVQGWGVEIIAEGTRVAGDSSLGKEPWWETKKDALSMLTGTLVHKSKTPFAYLFFDYDLPVSVR